MAVRKMVSFLAVISLALLVVISGKAQTTSGAKAAVYQYQQTRDLVTLVNEAAEQVQTKGTAAFAEFRVSGSRWRHGETYIFVLDPQGNMLVHPDQSMQGKNELNLKDVNGRPIIRGLIAAATVSPNKPEGWYHYEWPVPGGILPRWKSSYVRLVTAPSGKKYIVGAGMYNDRMEKAFVVDEVEDAVAEINKDGSAAFPLLHDPKGPFIVKDSYIFVLDTNGVELVNPGFPNLQGRSVLNYKDAQGKQPIREMVDLVKTKGSGWVDYMWPKPGESVPTQKSAYVSKAMMGNEPVIVGSGVYLANAPKMVSAAKRMTAPELMTLVGQAAAVLSKEGSKAYPEFSQKGSKWFHGDTYLFVYSLVDGIRVFHAANPASEGLNVNNLKDIHGRPIGKRILDVARGPSGEGWVHYMYPEPGGLFPEWKSTFVKRVTFPSGKEYLVGCGIYNMQMDAALVQDVVNRAAALVAKEGDAAFSQLRDKTGQFYFMDTYVFVDSPDGIELVNPAQPSLEGKNILNMKDIKGNAVGKEYIGEAMKNGSGWVEYYWYRPGSNTPALKRAFVKKVQSGAKTYIVGSGYYVAQ